MSQNLFLFCRDCGHKNEYTFKKPNFCENCGYKFAHASVEAPQKKAPPTQTQKPRRVVEEDIQDEENIEITPLTQFSFEADLEATPKFKFEQIAHTKKPSSENRGRGSGGMSAKEVKENMKNLFAKDKQRANDEPNGE